MCIICKGSIYIINIYEIRILNVSGCKVLTSEKLQEILTQCKSLKDLYCNCCNITSLNLRENKYIEHISCIECQYLSSINLRSNINLTTLWCNDCTSLTSLDLQECINLTTLRCYNCISLTSLDLLSNSEGVTSLGCINLVTLWCYNCTSLTSLKFCKKLKSLCLRNCRWISQNDDFSSNLQRLTKIQRWYRRLVLIKYIKSREFVEWIYNPNNIGGKFCKKNLLREISEMK